MKNIFLSSGPHNRVADGTCLMEAVACIAGELHSDKPNCVDETLIEIGITLNDNITDDKERNELLIPFLWRLPGTYNIHFQEIRKQKFEEYKRSIINNLYSHGDIVLSAGLLNRKNFGGFYKDICDIFTKRHFLFSFFNSTIKHDLLSLFDELINLTEIKEIAATKEHINCGK